MPLPPARMLKQTEAAEYVGVSKMHFLRMVNDGEFPDATYRKGHIVLWDRLVLDSVIDSWSAKPAGQLDDWSDV